MSEHKYKVGQTVEVRMGLLGARPVGAFEVTRRLPPTGSSNQYRIKSRDSGQERVVREDDIVRMSAESLAAPAPESPTAVPALMPGRRGRAVQPAATRLANTPLPSPGA